MVMRPAPRTFTCSACGWFKNTAPRSDALMPGDYYRECPVCEHTPLDVKRTNPIQSAVDELAKRLGFLNRF